MEYEKAESIKIVQRKQIYKTHINNNELTVNGDLVVLMRKVVILIEKEIESRVRKCNLEMIGKRGRSLIVLGKVQKRRTR